MKIRKWARTIHKYLGLISGLIVFVVSITGCIYCFHDEIKDLTCSQYRIVVPRNAPYLSPSRLQHQAQGLLPNARIDDIAYYGSSRSAVVSVSFNQENRLLYFNPYDGQLLNDEISGDGFFDIVLRLHRTLLLPKTIGKQLVGVSTILFVVLIISGLVLWFPKRRSQIRRGLTIKWNAKRKRLNYDWHKTVGFYSALFALFIAFSGLVFTYAWMKQSVYQSINFGGDYAKETDLPPIDSTYCTTTEVDVLDRVFAQTMQHDPKAEMIYIIPSYQTDSPIVSCSYPHTLRYDHQSNFYFYPTDGSLLKEVPYDVKSKGLQLIESCYGIHTGQFLGLFGKCIAFISSLLIASLAVTGILIWVGKVKK